LDFGVGGIDVDVSDGGTQVVSSVELAVFHVPYLIGLYHLQVGAAPIDQRVVLVCSFFEVFIIPERYLFRYPIPIGVAVIDLLVLTVYLGGAEQFALSLEVFALSDFAVTR